MRCIEKIKHNVPHCTAEKGLQIFYDDGKGKYTGYCFSCAAKGLEAYVANPYEDGVEREPPKKKPREEIEAEIAEIRALQTPNFTLVFVWRSVSLMAKLPTVCVFHIH